MAKEIVMPKLGLTMTTGTVVKWLLAEGDEVHKGDPLLEISTEKIVNVVESPADGVLLSIVAPEGAELPVGALLAYVGARGEAVEGPPGGAAEQESEGGTVPAGKKKVKISPLAARLARELNIDYTLIPGTGPGGRIVKEDVEKFAAGAKAAPEKAAPAAWPSSFDVVPYAGMRKVIGENMSRSWATAARVTHHVSTDVAALVALRQMINEGAAKKVSLTDLLVKLVARALVLRPGINVSLDGGNIKKWKDVNVGVAVALETGLVVPVIRNADKKSVLAVNREVRALVQKAREGRLTADDLTGGTFTVTNLGSFGSVDYFTPVINQPESAILGVGRVVEAPAAVEGRVEVRPVMGLSLSFDHRIIDGAPAAEFLAVLLSLIASPLRAILADEADPA